MANKTTVTLTVEQYQELIHTMLIGGAGFRPNHRIATALVLEANLGLRIEDILQLHLSDIIRDGSRYRLDIVEKKTGKKRTFTVPYQVRQYIEDYCQAAGLTATDQLFPITERAVQKYLQKVANYLGYERIGTHSFRKYYATDIYRLNGNDIVLVQELLQHSSTATTRRYIGISADRIEQAIQSHINLI